MEVKPRNVNVSVIEVEGKIKVWNASFTLDTPVLAGGASPEDFEAARKGIEKVIADKIRSLTFEVPK